MTVRKYTNQITIQDWTVVQMWASAGNQLADSAPLDDVSGVGTGPFLVFEHGIWKYPQQASVGRFKVPVTTGKPVRLIGVMADFGANTAFTVSVAGIDNTPQRPDNTSGTPYPAADAALYREGDIQVLSGTSRYLSTNLNTSANGLLAVMSPGMDVIVTTAAGVAPLVRLIFGLGYEHY